jgi:hypothetical protein
MTLLHLHHDNVHSFAREERLPFRQVVRWIGAAFRRLHESIVSAKLRGAQSELMFRQDYNELLSPKQDTLPSDRDARNFPQRPLILDDKWDF